MATSTSAVTNERPSSCVPASVNVRTCLNFAAMWSAHPLNWNPPESAPFRKPKPKPKKDPTNPFAALTDVPGEPIYPDQCAIKLSIALQSGGLPLATYPKARSEVRPVEQLGRSIRGALAAEELADWLIKALGKPQSFAGSEALAKIKGKKGIVFFKDFWQRPGETTVQGDHIDLWNGTTTPNVPPASYEGEGTYFTRSKSVWFWELN
jgi:Type VI secretion system (T6SS), amidase effector protein 4